MQFLISCQVIANCTATVTAILGHMQFLWQTIHAVESLLKTFPNDLYQKAEEGLASVQLAALPEQVMQTVLDTALQADRQIVTDKPVKLVETSPETTSITQQGNVDYKGTSGVSKQTKISSLQPSKISPQK